MACARMKKTDIHKKICCVAPDLITEQQNEIRKNSIIPITLSKGAFHSPEFQNSLRMRVADGMLCFIIWIIRRIICWAILMFPDIMRKSRSRKTFCVVQI